MEFDQLRPKVATPMSCMGNFGVGRPVWKISVPDLTEDLKSKGMVDLGHYGHVLALIST